MINSMGKILLTVNIFSADLSYAIKVEHNEKSVINFISRGTHIVE